MSRRRDKSVPKPDPSQEEMSLTEHLAELRMRIIRAGLAVLIGAIVVVAFYDRIMGWMLQPYVNLCERKPAGFAALIKRDAEKLSPVLSAAPK